MTINTAEIEERANRGFGDRRASEGSTWELDCFQDRRNLLAALKAETARADKAENGLLDEAERSADLQSQLTAANEKLAAYAKAEKDAAELYDWVMSVCENPPEPTPALRAVWEKYKDLPAFSTGDGNGR